MDKIEVENARIIEFVPKNPETALWNENNFVRNCFRPSKTGMVIESGVFRSVSISGLFFEGNDHCRSVFGNTVYEHNWSFHYSAHSGKNSRKIVEIAIFSGWRFFGEKKIAIFPFLKNHDFLEKIKIFWKNSLFFPTNRPFSKNRPCLFQLHYNPQKSPCLF